jgi:hypothetical protein
MGKKGFQNKRGIPELWDELKTRINISLTPTAVKGLDELAQQRELSRSELVERIGRGVIPLGDQSVQ